MSGATGSGDKSFERNRSKRLRLAYKSLPGPMAAPQFQHFVDFQSRLDTVERFSSIKIRDAQLGTQESQYIFLKISLAWSVLEQVIAITGRKDSFSIENKQLSKAISAGKFDELLSALRNSKSREFDAVKSLKDYRAGKANTKLNNFAKAIRNATFHASINPTRAGLSKSPVRQRLLLGLANSILDKAVDEFELWCESRVVQTLNNS